MNILLISDEYPPYVFGGVAFYVESLATELGRHGHRVTVLTAGPRDADIRTRKVRVVYLKTPDAPGRHLWFQLINKERLVEFAEDADIVHFQACSCSLALRDMKTLGKPLVLTSHGSYKELMRTHVIYGQVPSLYDLKDFFNSPYSLAFHAYLHGLDVQYADRVIAVSKHLKNELIRDYGLCGSSRQIHVIPPIGETFSTLRSSNGSRTSSGGKLRIIYVGRLHWAKGVQFLAKSLKRIVREHHRKKVTLEIVGRGPLELYLRKYVSKNKLEKNVLFSGFLDREQAMRRVRDSDIFVLPSLYEACSISLLEAASLSTPSLIFDVPWTQEYGRLLPNVSLVTPLDSESLADAILNVWDAMSSGRRLFSNRELRKKIQDNYGSAAVLGRILTVYQEVLASG